MQYASPFKLRAYFMGNMYLSPIQQGIQAAHVVTKLFAAHRPDFTEAGDTLYEWADVGVTKILLNGGYQSNLADVYKVFEFVAPILNLPFAKFHEEEVSLNGALTSVGIIVPAEVYEMEMNYWSDAGMPFELVKTPQDVLAMIPNLNQARLARADEGAINFASAMLNVTLKSARLA